MKEMMNEMKMNLFHVKKITHSKVMKVYTRRWENATEQHNKVIQAS